MKKLLKVAAIVVAVLLVVLIVAPMALRGKVAGIVKREANAMLRAELDFEKLDISLLRHFPHASVDLKGLTLIGTERFAGDTIVAARRISVVVDLLSLFSDEGFEVTKVILAAPSVHAHKLADGAVNWDVMKPSEEEAPQKEEIPDGEPSAFRLRIRDFRISATRTIRRICVFRPRRCPCACGATWRPTAPILRCVSWPRGCTSFRTACLC